MPIQLKANQAAASALVLSSGCPRGDARDAGTGITGIDVDLVAGSSVSGLLGPF